MTVLAFLTVDVLEIGFMNIPAQYRSNAEANIFCISGENNGVLEAFLRKKGLEIIEPVKGERPELTTSNVIKVVEHDDDKDNVDIDLAQYFISKDKLQELGATYAQGQEYSRAGTSLASMILVIN